MIHDPVDAVLEIVSLLRTVRQAELEADRAEDALRDARAALVRVVGTTETEADREAEGIIAKVCDEVWDRCSAMTPIPRAEVLSVISLLRLVRHKRDERARADRELRSALGALHDAVGGPDRESAEGRAEQLIAEHVIANGLGKAP